MKAKKLLNYFSKTELAIWLSSMTIILSSFLLFGDGNYLNLFASLVGTTSLIFVAKGNPIGQALMLLFCILYGIISLTFSYYGEMITYLGMSAPMCLFALISWLKNPYNGNRSQVKINKLKAKDITVLIIAIVPVSIALYFILETFGTRNLIPSTISVATSFIAAYLTFKRSIYFSLAYAINDIVLIILWSLAIPTDTSYISVVICFVIFLVNDTYTFFNWSRMKKKQESSAKENIHTL